MAHKAIIMDVGGNMYTDTRVINVADLKSEVRRPSRSFVVVDGR